MADRSWLGRAKKVAQVGEITITGPVLVGEVWTVTINGKDITFTATVGTTGNVTAGLVALLSASNAPAEFAEATWVDADPKITVTAKAANAGIPITITVSTDSALGSIVYADTTAATGPEFLNNTANWSGGALPVSTDNIFFGPAEYGPKYAAASLSAVTPTLIDIAPNISYQIGLPRINASGAYTEYRATKISFAGCTTFRVRGGDGTGLTLGRFDFGATAVTTIVEKTGTSAEANAPALNIIGTHADNALEVLAGSVGVGFFSDETATCKTIIQSGGTITCGIGVTLSGAGSSITVSGGSTTARTNVITVTVDSGGAFTLQESATVTTLTVNEGGTANYNSSGTCTTANVSGTLSFTGDRSARTVTTLNLNKRGTVNGLQSVTITTLALGSNVVSASAA